MVDLRRIAIIFVIAVLFAIFVNAVISAFYPQPKYEEFCKSSYADKMYITPEKDVVCTKFTEPTEQEIDLCAEKGGELDYRVDAKGCRTAYKGCNTCNKDFNAELEKYNFAYFIISSILALLAIIVGLLLPQRISLNEWLATGFMLGGLFALFYGTALYYQNLGRFIKPLVIAVEMAIVIYLSYKKLHAGQKLHK